MEIKKIISSILLAVSLVVAVVPKPAFAATESAASCGSGISFSNTFGFIFNVGSTWGALIALNSITSSLAGIEFEFKPTIAGFSIGGFTAKDVFEPIDETMDKLYGYWLGALFFGAVGSAGAALSSYLVQVALDLNSSLLKDNQVVTFGYSVVVGLVNLGFVIAIVVIAFATMFRRSGWDAKSSLAKLIIAVLLINFSLFFAGIILTTSTNLTAAILQDRCINKDLLSNLNIIKIEENINEALSPAPPDLSGEPSFSVGEIKELSKKSENQSKISTFLFNAVTWPFKKFLVNILALFFASGLTIIGALTIFGIFLFLIIRYIAVIILLIFMPIIWLGFVFPQLQVPGLGNAWSGWWKEYLKWMIVGPIIAFFLLLTIKLMNAIPSLVTGGAFQGIVQILVVIIFSLSGLYAANKMGAVGGAMMYGAVSKLGTMGLAKLKTTGKETAARFGNSFLGSEMGRKMTAGMQKTPAFRPIGRQLNTLGAKTEKILANEDRFKDLSPDRLAQMVPALHGPDVAIALSKLEKSNDLNKVPDLKKYISKEWEASFKNIGKNFRAIEVASGVNVKAMEEFKLGNYEKAQEELQKLHSNLSKKELMKFPANNIYGDYDKKNPFLGMDESSFSRLQTLMTGSVISNPGDLNKIAPNIKSKNFDNFFESVIKSALPNESIPPIRTEIKLGGGGVLKTSFRDVAKNRAYLMDRLKAEREDIYKALSKTLSSRETGLGFTPEVEEIVQPTP